MPHINGDIIESCFLCLLGNGNRSSTISYLSSWIPFDTKQSMSIVLSMLFYLSARRQAVSRNLCLSPWMWAGRPWSTCGCETDLNLTYLRNDHNAIDARAFMEGNWLLCFLDDADWVIRFQKTEKLMFGRTNQLISTQSALSIPVILEAALFIPLPRGTAMLSCEMNKQKHGPCCTKDQ